MIYDDEEVFLPFHYNSCISVQLSGDGMDMKHSPAHQGPGTPRDDNDMNNYSMGGGPYQDSGGNGPPPPPNVSVLL